MIGVYLLGIITGMGIAVIINWTTKEKPLVTPADEPAAHLYGHKWPPTVELRKKLPNPPVNHRWEINVDTDKAGQYIMHLTLVNIATGENVAATTGNLTWRHYESWSRIYLESKLVAKDLFATDLINPMVDWAIATNNKLNPITASDYTLE
jgi:hypothetical protein